MKHFIIGAAALLALTACAAAPGGVAQAEPGVVTVTATPQEASESATAEPVEEPTEPAEDMVGTMTESEFDSRYEEYSAATQQAIESAFDYINSGDFSKEGLIGQLEYEGFSRGERTSAVDFVEEVLTTDLWLSEARGSAESYLDSGSFSRKGLIDQLLYEGFTREQATFGVDEAGL